MFGIFKKNPLKKLKDEYASKLKDAMIGSKRQVTFLNTLSCLKKLI
jgi:hypothetical protein